MLKLSVEQEIKMLQWARAKVVNTAETFVCIDLKYAAEALGICDYSSANDLDVVKEVMTYIECGNCVESHLFGLNWGALSPEQMKEAKQFRLNMIDDMLAKRGVKC